MEGRKERESTVDSQHIRAGNLPCLADILSGPQGLSSRTKASALCTHHPGLPPRMGLGVQQELGKPAHPLALWGEAGQGVG